LVREEETLPGERQSSSLVGACALMCPHCAWLTLVIGVRRGAEQTCGKCLRTFRVGNATIRRVYVNELPLGKARLRELLKGFESASRAASR
jgi:hypothetical protein